VIANVDEADIGEVTDGQKVTFTVDAFPNDLFNGSVTQVRLKPTTTSNVVTYEVVVDAPNPDLKLKPGLTANITIITLEKTDILLVAVKALRFTPDSIPAGKSMPGSKEKQIWIQTSNGVNPIKVIVGVSDNINTEVSGEIKEGDKVVTGVSKIASSTAVKSSDSGTSPFMPKRPGQK
jgi:HlyD family secretion protein